MGLADEADLPHLRAVALDFIVHNFPAVSATAAWAQLPRSCADVVTADAAARFKRALGLMHSMNAQYKAGPTH
jgi:hypothetical protein